MASTLPRPDPLQVIFDQIPVKLQYLNQWVMWRYVWVEGKDGKPGKWDKPPLQTNGKNASSTAALTWSTFQAVKGAYESGLNLSVDDPLHFDGVGFVPAKVNQAENNLQFGDLDKCRDKETGQLSPDAKEDLDLINSFCEISPSETGIRFIAIGNPPYPPGKDGGKNGHVELYQSKHYLTITGHRLDEYPATIEKRPDELNAFYQKHFSKPEPEQPKEGVSQNGNGSKWTDDQVRVKAAMAANKIKFLELLEGKWQHFQKPNGELLYPSQSEADIAFCELLAFYTTDPEQIDRIFRGSGLYREKWDREDYRQSTISLAIERTTEHYSGNGSNDLGEGRDPAIRTVTKDDKKDAIGVCPDTGAVRVVVEMEKDGTKSKFLAWVSDCAVHIHTETKAKDDTEFIFCGIGAVDKRAVRFTMPASSLQSPKSSRRPLSMPSEPKTVSVHSILRWLKECL